ncbi:MAG: hypothetical protein HOI70_08430 [Opitutae bacterium]|nr:hypothetical protein [Opitutae bacterium]
MKKFTRMVFTYFFLLVSVTLFSGCNISNEEVRGNGGNTSNRHQGVVAGGSGWSGLTSSANALMSSNSNVGTGLSWYQCGEEKPDEIVQFSNGEASYCSGKSVSAEDVLDDHVGFIFNGVNVIPELFWSHSQKLFYNDIAIANDNIVAVHLASFTMTSTEFFVTLAMYNHSQDDYTIYLITYNINGTIMGVSQHVTNLVGQAFTIVSEKNDLEYTLNIGDKDQAASLTGVDMSSGNVIWKFDSDELFISKYLLDNLIN